MGLVIRTAGDPAAFATTLRHEVQALDKDQPIYNVRTMDDVVANSLGTRRVSMQLFTVFACAALLVRRDRHLWRDGLFRHATHSGNRHPHGARRAKVDVLRLVVRQGMTLVAIGVVVGLVGALGLTRVISNLLFGVRRKRSDDIHRDLSAAHRRRVRRLLFARAARREARSSNRAHTRLTSHEKHSLRAPQDRANYYRPFPGLSDC